MNKCRIRIYDIYDIKGIARYFSKQNYYLLEEWLHSNADENNHKTDA